MILLEFHHLVLPGWPIFDILSPLNINCWPCLYPTSHKGATSGLKKQNRHFEQFLCFSAAAVQWTRHMLASYSFGSNSLHNLPLHNCLCGVNMQGHLIIIDCQVTRNYLKKNCKKVLSPDSRRLLSTRSWCNGLNWPKLIRTPPI